MIQQPKRFIDSLYGRYLAGRAAIDHDHRQAECAGGRDLAVGRLTTAVLGDDHVDAMLLEESDLVFNGKGAAGQNVLDGGRGQRRFHRIDAADEIVVLRRSIEVKSLLPADGEEDAPGFRAQRADRLFDRGNARPAIALDGPPAGALEPDQRHACKRGRTLGIGRNLFGEGMGGVDQQVHAVVAEIAGEPIHTAETAGANRHGLRRRIDGAASQGQRHVEIVTRGKPVCKLAGLGGAAQYEGAFLVHA